MKKITVTILLLTIAATLLTACTTKTEVATAVPTASQPNLLISEGRLVPTNTQDQSFVLSGQVAEVLVKDGEAVQTGQVLARLVSPAEFETALVRAQQEVFLAKQALDALKTSADLNLAQARLAVMNAGEVLDKAQTRYDADKSDKNQALLDEAKAQLKLAEDTQAKLQAGQGVDPDAMAAAEARLASANAGLKSAQSALDNLELKASLDGTIVDLNLQVGQRVTAGQPVLNVADFSQWLVKTDNLTETDVVNIKIGQKANIVFDALPGKTLTAEVTHINRLFEEKRGDITYTVTLVLTQTDPALRWGMTAAVQFIP